MITRKKMIIPIYDYSLEVIVYDSWNEVKDMTPFEYEPHAFTKLYHGKAVVALNVNSEASIVHEAEHVKNGVWDFIGYTPQVNNDEPDAYLLAYIYGKLLHVFLKHKEYNNDR